jgi:hypothetical protein
VKYLLDTCVLSECARRNPDARLVAWLETTAEGDDFYVSAITIGEIAEGIESLPDGDPRKLRLDAWFRTEILGTYGDRIVDFDREAALAWGRIKGATSRAGLVRPDLDAQIAATALAHGMTVATRNVSDMAHTGVPVVNPFA